MKQARRPSLVVVAALDRRGAIGRGGQLLWHERADQQHFRDVTLGHPVLMGRKTWDSLPERFRPLPGRCNIVVTRNKRWHADGAERADSLEQALALPLADDLLLTEIDAAFEGADTYFPPIDRASFNEVAREPHSATDARASRS